MIGSFQGTLYSAATKLEHHPIFYIMSLQKAPGQFFAANNANGRKLNQLRLVFICVHLRLKKRREISRSDLNVNSP